MSNDNDAKQLKRWFQIIIESVNEIITKFQSLDGSIDDKATRNSILNNDLNTFTLNEQEDELMDDLKIRIENLLSEYIGRLSKRCQKYLFNFLHQYEYDSETRKFNNVFIQSILLLFEHDLQEILSSVIVVGLSE